MNGEDPDGNAVNECDSKYDISPLIAACRRCYGKDLKVYTSIVEALLDGGATTSVNRL